MEVSYIKVQEVDKQNIKKLTNSKSETQDRSKIKNSHNIEGKSLVE